MVARPANFAKPPSEATAVLAKSALTRRRVLSSSPPELPREARTRVLAGRQISEQLRLKERIMRARGWMALSMLLAVSAAGGCGWKSETPQASGAASANGTVAIIDLEEVC